ncbi:MAG: acyl-ACP--UDP-N-acetylglucosamine O-acyltransferase [Endomicrobia bacterium]|nr:acyl-ACP--UDP-N-acetylglucosamine O-acyltransferase [Endomicrobiia bacterium]
MESINEAVFDIKNDHQKERSDILTLDREQIKSVIPHREPFLLIDKVEIIEREKSAVGYKQVTGFEDFFRGHFPGNPIMPGVLVIESMAQTACVLYLFRPDLRGKFAYFMSIEKTKFRKPVRPGDLLRLNVEVVKARERAGKVRGVAYVDNTIVAESEFMFVLVDREEAEKELKSQQSSFVQVQMNVHPTTIVHPTAVIHPTAKIGPYSVIGPDVIIEENVQVGSYCNIEYATIKQNTRIFDSVCIGTLPQDIKYKGEKTRVIIGENCVIREFVTIHRGTTTKLTSVGNNCYLMAYSHIAHDCRVGNDVTFANGGTLAGHVIVEDGVTIGGLVAVHQYVRIGKYSMLGGGAMVSKDVPPYVMVVGDRAELWGINVIGLRRKGFSKDKIKEIKTVYKKLFRSKLPLSEAIKLVERENNYSEEVKYMLDFIKSSKRGICRTPRRK